jgi:Nucleotidyl transferase
MNANDATRDPHPSPPYARRAMAYVLAGRRGSRLMELTDKRAKPAVYFGGNSRIIRARALAAAIKP